MPFSLVFAQVFFSALGHRWGWLIRLATVEGYFQKLKKIFQKVNISQKGVKIHGKIVVVYFSLNKNGSVCFHCHGLDRQESLFQCFTVMFLLTMVSHEHVKDMTILSSLTLNLSPCPWIFRAPEITISSHSLLPDSSCLLNRLEVGSDPGASKLTNGHFCPHHRQVVITGLWSQFPNQPYSSLAAICPNHLWLCCCSLYLYHHPRQVVESSWLPVHQRFLAMHNGVLQGAVGRGLLALVCSWESRPLLKEGSNVTRSCFHSYARPLFQQCLKVPTGFSPTLWKALGFCRC